MKRRPANAFVLEKRVRAAQNMLFDIYFDRVTAPNGERVERYLVVAPKTRNKAGITGVAVLPIVNGRYGLLRLYRHPVADDVWEIPRGFMDRGEDARGAAVRELEEETQLRCRRSQVKSLGMIYPEAGILAARVQLFAADVANDAVPKVGAEFGHREFRLVTGREFERMIDAGAIRDPTTLVAYFQYVRQFVRGRADLRRRLSKNSTRQPKRKRIQ